MTKSAIFSKLGLERVWSESCSWFAKQVKDLKLRRNHDREELVRLKSYRDHIVKRYKDGLRKKYQELGLIVIMGYMKTDNDEEGLFIHGFLEVGTRYVVRGDHDDISEWNRLANARSFGVAAVHAETKKIAVALLKQGGLSKEHRLQMREIAEEPPIGGIEYKDDAGKGKEKA